LTIGENNHAVCYIPAQQQYSPWKYYSSFLAPLFLATSLIAALMASSASTTTHRYTHTYYIIHIT